MRVLEGAVRQFRPSVRAVVTLVVGCLFVTAAACSSPSSSPAEQSKIDLGLPLNPASGLEFNGAESTVGALEPVIA